MAIGSNVKLKDRLIKRTTQDVNNKNKGNNTSSVNKTNTVQTEMPIKHRGREIVTKETKKATFYVKKDLLQKLYNFAYWERYNITEALNTVLSDGLKGKNTKNK